MNSVFINNNIVKVIVEFLEQKRSFAHTTTGDSTAAMTIGCEKTLSSTSSSASEDFSENVLKNSKLLLTGSFTELKTNSFSESPTVQLYLTSNRELLVLKKTAEKPYKLSVVRRHNLKNTMFTQHPHIANAMQVEVPNTVLRYTYQLDNPESSVISLREWLAELARNKESLHLPIFSNPLLELDSSSQVGCCNDLTSYCPQKAINGLSLNTTTHLKKPHWNYTSPTSPVAQRRTFLPEDKESDFSSSPYHPKQVAVEESSTQPTAASNCVETPVTQSSEISVTDRVNSDESVNLSKYQDELDVLQMTREHRGSLRLDLHVQMSPHKILRSASERFVSGRMSHSRDADEDGSDKRKTSVSTSELCNLTSPITFPKCMDTCPLDTLPQCPDEKTEFLGSKFRHMQIRNRKWKYSPRFNRSASYQHTASNSTEEQVTRSTSVSPASVAPSHPTGTPPLPR